MKFALYSIHLTCFHRYESIPLASISHRAKWIDTRALFSLSYSPCVSSPRCMHCTLISPAFLSYFDICKCISSIAYSTKEVPYNNLMECTHKYTHMHRINGSYCDETMQGISVSLVYVRHERASTAFCLSLIGFKAYSDYDYAQQLLLWGKWSVECANPL